MISNPMGKWFSSVSEGCLTVAFLTRIINPNHNQQHMLCAWYTLQIKAWKGVGWGKYVAYQVFLLLKIYACIKFCLLKIYICVCLLPMDEIFWDYLFLLTRNRKKEKILSLYSMVHYLNINSYAYQATTNFFNFYN